jgi:PAS domain S-box-containing protein
MKSFLSWINLSRDKLHFPVVSIFSIFLVLLIIIIALFFRISHHFSETIIRSFHQDQLYLVKTVATGMQQIVNQLSQEIVHLSSLDALRNEETSASVEPLLQDFYRLFSGKIDSICKIDRNEKIQYIYPFTEKEIGKDMGNVHCVRDAYRNKKSTISQCFTTGDGDYVLAINQPIFRTDQEKEVVGVIRCIIHMDTLTGLFLQPLGMEGKMQGKKENIWIIDQDGLIIYHHDPSLILKNYKAIIGKTRLARTGPVGIPLTLPSPQGGEGKTGDSLAGDEGRGRKEGEGQPSAGQKTPYSAIKKGVEAWGIFPFWGKEQELYAFTPLLIGSKKWLIGITTPYLSLYSPIKNNHRNMFCLTLAIFGIFGLGGYLLHLSNKKRSLLEAETEFLKKQVELEEEIKKERDSLHNLFDSMADAVLVINDDYQVEFMNQPAISRFGEQIGRRCFQVLCGCDRPCSVCQLSDQAGTSSEQTLFHCHDCGRNRWYEVSAAPLIKNDQTKSIVEIIRDVTKEKELEERLVASEKKYHTLVSHTKDLIMVQDFQGTVLFVSESVENLLGYRVEEFYQRPFQQFLTESPVNDPWREEIGGQGDLQNRLQPHLLECKTRQGEKILLEANESAVFDREGQERQIMGVYRDITERKRLEEQLLESERLRMLSLTKRFRFGEIIGRNIKMQEVYELIDAVSQSKATVMIQGESGTGKELVARAIHYQGPWAKGPFIGISCSVLSENLLESELFGHVKGAFTGAIKDKTGRFELANGGTLFLDEVGDMSLTIQTKLLRVLQEREFEKVGGEKTIKVDVRIIAATNKDLKEDAARGRFREDLFYRLNVVEIRLPPLRERMDDLPLLVAHFIEKYNQQTNKGITNLSTEAMSILSHYPWPGNVRELEHVIEHAFVRCDKTSILAKHLPHNVTEHKTSDIIKAGVKSGLSKDEIEKDILLNALEELGWNLGMVMQKLNISRPTLWRKMKKYGLSQKSS